MTVTLPFSRLDAAWTLNDDGSFGYTAGGVSLTECMPAFNGHPISTKSVEVKRLPSGGEITYHLLRGSIRLVFTADAGSLILKSTLDVPAAPHWFYPIAYAKVTGADRYLKQGIGFSGPSGIFPFPQTPRRRETHQPDEAWSYDSYLVSGLLSPDEQALAIGSYQHDRFLQRSSYRNRPYRYNLVDRHLESNAILFEAGFATEELPLSAPLELPDLHFVAGTQPFATFRGFAQNVAASNHVVFDNKPHYQVCTFWEFFTDYNQERLDDLLAGLKTVQPPLPIETIQVDGGFCTYGDWLIPNHRYPSGLEHMVRTILAAGFKAGIWIAPFMVASSSVTAKDHPDWLLRDQDGKVHLECTVDGFEINILDTTHPAAFAYLRQVFKAYRSWGISYYKTDFMEYGSRDRTRFRRHDNSTTSAQHLTDVIRMIREEIGPDSLWLACIAFYAPFIGYADATRISNDVPSKWTDNCHGNLIQEAFTMHYLQQVLWQNDPDCIFLRDVDSGLKSELSRDEAYTLAYWNAMIGGFITTSDRFHKITPEYLRLWRFLQPGRQQLSCRFPFWSGSKRLKVAVRDYSDGSSAVLIVNPFAEVVEEGYAVNDLVADDAVWVFGWGPEGCSPKGRKSSLSASLRPHQSILYYMNKANAAPARGLTIFGETSPGMTSPLDSTGSGEVSLTRTSAPQ